MTQVQQTPQAETDNTKAAPEVKKRGPKPKNAVNAAVSNNPESKPQNEEKGPEQSNGLNSSSQTELQASKSSEANSAQDSFKAQGNTAQNESGENIGDQSQSGDLANEKVKTESENNQPPQPQDNVQGDKGDQIQSGDGQDKNEQRQNNENIVVHETVKLKDQPKQDLSIKVKNDGFKAVYEPFSKTTIEPGDEETTIQCANRADLKTVLANIDQLNTLGKKIKVVNDE